MREVDDGEAAILHVLVLFSDFLVLTLTYDTARAGHRFTRYRVSDLDGHGVKDSFVANLRIVAKGLHAANTSGTESSQVPLLTFVILPPSRLSSFGR